MTYFFNKVWYIEYRKFYYSIFQEADMSEKKIVGITMGDPASIDRRLL